SSIAPAGTLDFVPLPLLELIVMPLPSMQVEPSAEIDAVYGPRVSVRTGVPAPAPQRCSAPASWPGSGAVGLAVHPANAGAAPDPSRMAAPTAAAAPLTSRAPSAGRDGSQRERGS